jgi:hypothetical protein
MNSPMSSPGGTFIRGLVGLRPHVGDQLFDRLRPALGMLWQQIADQWHPSVTAFRKMFF